MTEPYKYESHETPHGMELGGTSNAGGAGWTTTKNPVKGLSHMLKFFQEYYTRDDQTAVSLRGIDHQHRPPKWMENKDVAVDGTPLTRDARRQPGYWEHKYAKELAIGQAVATHKAQRRFEYLHSLIGSTNQRMRQLGLKKKLDVEQSKKEALAAFEAEQHEKEFHKSSKQLRRPSASATWDAIVTSIETNRPLAKVAQEYRPKMDFYGLDSFIDSAPSFVWFATKVGMFIGLVIGTGRTASVVNVDAQYLRASGIGILSVLNITVFASVVKWGGNLGLFAAAFIAGDRLVTRGKQLIYPAHDASQRSVANYVGAMSFGLSLIGTMPWWLLNDKRFAFRLAVGGSFIGACLGAVVGTALDRLVSMNLSRLDASNRDIRRFEALMKREALWIEHESKKDPDSARNLLF